MHDQQPAVCTNRLCPTGQTDESLTADSGSVLHRSLSSDRGVIQHGPCGSEPARRLLVTSSRCQMKQCENHLETMIHLESEPTLLLPLQMEVGGTREMSNQEKKKVQVKLLNHLVGRQKSKRGGTNVSSFNVGENQRRVFFLCVFRTKELKQREEISSKERS